MQEDAFRFFEFGPFRLNVNDRLLERNSELVPLTPKVFDMLLLLVEHRGRVLDKNDLIDSLWPDSFVEESSLTQNISLLRRALGEGGSENRYIQTIPKRGYRFVGSVQEVRLSSSELMLQERSSMEVLRDGEVEPEQGNCVSRPAAHMLLSGIRGKRWRLIGAGSLLIFITSLVVFSFHKRQSLNELMGARSLAILPFQTIGPNKEELFGVGMADAIIIRLSGPNRPAVLPTSSVLKYAMRDKNTLAIGKELGVDAVLDGTLQREGDQVRVTAQLIRSSDGQVLWSGKFDEYYRSSFALQDSLADQLAGALAVRNLNNTREAQRPTHDQAAYDAYLTGLYFWNRRNKENLAKAIHYFEEAIQRDQNFALAHALLADCHYLDFIDDMGSPPKKETLTRARNETAQALKLDDSLAEAHTVRAGLAALENDTTTADREFQRALELNSSYAVAHLRYGYFLFALQRLDAASSHVAQAQQLDPASPFTNGARGFIFFMTRDYESAADAYRRALELQPDMSGFRFNLGVIYVTKGMFKEALSEFDKLEATDALSAAKGKLWAYGVSGYQDEARRAASKLKQVADPSRITAYDLIFLYIALGDNDKAFEWLEKVELNLQTAARLKFEPQLDRLRADVRFAQYVSRHQHEFLAHL